MALAATWVPSKRPMWNYVIATAAIPDYSRRSEKLSVSVD